MKFQPVIKWSGSKRSQSEEIIKRFPKQIDTYYEPFLGGGSVLFQLMNSNIEVNYYNGKVITKISISKKMILIIYIVKNIYSKRV